MRGLTRPGRRLILCSLIVIGAVAIVEACSTYATFRAYLTGSIWRPTLRYVSEFTTGAPAENPMYVPYAGMWPTAGPADITRVRTAYRALFPDSSSVALNNGMASLNWPDSTIGALRNLVNSATAANDTERHELDLLKCKIDLRGVKSKTDPSLSQVESCFENYLRSSRPPALASEARGWLARTDYLLDKGARASKYYLDELKSSVSNIHRERLLQSLALIQPYSADLEGYFDTAEHALFAVNKATTSVPWIAPELVTKLEQHADLFKAGAESDALILALMRTSIQAGAPAATLRYADRALANPALRESAEYNWLAGVARYQEKDYAGAESLLKAVLLSGNDIERNFAAAALEGVYAKLDRPLDQLWAALQVSDPGYPYTQAMPLYPDASHDLYKAYLVGWNIDISYLLDVQLTDAQLDEYLQRYPDAPGSVRYARAVHHARREQYDEAARIFDGLAASRAGIMRQAERMLAQTKSADRSPQQKLETLYDYGYFLASNQDGIFFNDTLWHGFQTSGFLSRNPDEKYETGGAAPFTAEEAKHLQELERTLRDDQEEYWRAYKIFDQVVQQAGRSELGRRAATQAITCLRKIRTDRFGRAQEIRAADVRLTNWLAAR